MKRFDRLVALSARILPFWFLGWSLVRIQQLGWTGISWDLSFIGRDFAIYRNAADALLSTGNPWTASAPWNGSEWHFAAAPTAAQLFVPFLAIPVGLGYALFTVLSIGVVLLGLRRIGAPAWWLMFPPMSEGLVAGNPQILVLGLLLVGTSTTAGRRGATAAIARAIAAGLKVYALLPAAARREWRALATAAALLAVSVVLAPGTWRLYVEQFTVISARVVSESNGGLSAALFLDPNVFGSALPPSETIRLAASVVLYGLMVGLVLLVAVRDVPSSAWLAVALLWPAAEYHLATMTIPVARRVSTWVIAIPTIPTYLVGLVILAYELASAAPAMHPTEEAEPAVPLRTFLLRRETTAP